MAAPAPPALTAAVAKAATPARARAGGMSVAQFEELLLGIWRKESGATFPNPYANGLGYGGAFGTRVVAPFGAASDTKMIPSAGAAAVQQQADTAAAILSRQLALHQGDVSQALLAYSGGGYSSVGSSSGGSIFSRIDQWVKTHDPVSAAAANETTPSANPYNVAGKAASAASAVTAVPGEIASGFQTAATTAGHWLMHGILYAALLGLAVVLAIFGLMQLTGVNRRQIAQTLGPAAVAA